MADSRDSYGEQRKEKMQNSMSLYRCHTIFNVSRPLTEPALDLTVVLANVSQRSEPGDGNRKDEAGDGEGSIGHGRVGHVVCSSSYCGVFSASIHVCMHTRSSQAARVT